MNRFRYRQNKNYKVKDKINQKIQKKSRIELESYIVYVSRNTVNGKNIQHEIIQLRRKDDRITQAAIGKDIHTTPVK